MMMRADDPDLALDAIRIHRRLCEVFHRASSGHYNDDNLVFPWSKTSGRYQQAVLDGIKAVISELGEIEDEMRAKGELATPPEKCGD